MTFSYLRCIIYAQTAIITTTAAAAAAGISYFIDCCPSHIPHGSSLHLFCIYIRVHIDFLCKYELKAIAVIIPEISCFVFHVLHVFHVPKTSHCYSNSNILDTNFELAINTAHR